ncbi:MAG: hypothetical protein ACK4TA_04235 [Saprospiraceae bacterium]
MQVATEHKAATSLQILILRVFGLLALAALPFILLIRVAVWLHEQYHVFAWMSVFFAALFTAALLFLYVMYVHHYFVPQTFTRKLLQRNYAITLVLVLMYCANGVWSVSAINVKETAVKQEFRTLHPIIRLSISTLILLEKDLILTDAERKPEDYHNLGLASKNQSLHYIQSTGYAHAVDIRTKGHGWLRNKLIQSYFQLMGFNTLMHTGTAEHLHVSLSSVDTEGI